MAQARSVRVVIKREKTRNRSLQWRTKKTRLVRLGPCLQRQKWMAMSIEGSSSSYGLENDVDLIMICCFFAQGLKYYMHFSPKQKQNFLPQFLLSSSRTARDGGIFLMNRENRRQLKFVRTKGEHSGRAKIGATTFCCLPLSPIFAWLECSKLFERES